MPTVRKCDGCQRGFLRHGFPYLHGLFCGRCLRMTRDTGFSSGLAEVLAKLAQDRARRAAHSGEGESS